MLRDILKFSDAGSLISLKLQTKQYKRTLRDAYHPHRWFSGRMLACHAGGPGSIPGRCIFFSWLLSALLAISGALEIDLQDISRLSYDNAVIMIVFLK